MSRWRVGFIGLALGTAACTAKSPPPVAKAASADTSSAIVDDEPPHKIFGCLVGDSAVFADVRPDPESGDSSGVWITLVRAGSGIDGWREIGSAGRVDTLPFLRVQLIGEDSIAIDAPAAETDDTSRFIGRVSCERLWGRQRERRDRPSTSATYRRIYAAPVEAEPGTVP